MSYTIEDDINRKTHLLIESEKGRLLSRIVEGDMGEIFVEITYEDGKQEGLGTKWHTDGTLADQTRFKNGKPIFENEPDLSAPKILEGLIGKAVKWETLKQVGGLYHVAGNPEPYTGWTKKFHDNGKVAALGMLKGGKPDGLWTLWGEDGRKEEETRYQNGVKIVVE